MNINSDVYIYRDFEKMNSWTFAFKNIYHTIYSAMQKARQSIQASK